MAMTFFGVQEKPKMQLLPEGWEDWKTSRDLKVQLQPEKARMLALTLYNLPP